MIPRPDLLAPDSPAGLEVFQLTTEPDVPSSHIYMEAQIFTPDSKRFVLHRSSHSHGSDRHDPKHRYLLCDLENHGELIPLTDELGPTAPALSPDGAWMYYFINRTEINGGQLILKRVALDRSRRETLLTLDAPLPGTPYRPSNIYPISTISSDGLRLAIPAYLGDGRTPNAPWGLMIFDLVKAEVRLILEGPSWCNLHPQYCRSTDPRAAHDLLIQENHGNTCDAKGQYTQLVSGRGADIHIIRDDGTNLRDLPWGRVPEEHCQGHQCWWGNSEWAITGTCGGDRRERLIAGRAAPHANHLGRAAPGAVRLDLSRNFPEPHFLHFGTDHLGRRLITDHGPSIPGGGLFITQLHEAGRPQRPAFRFLLSPKTDFKNCHIHPFLSPDGKTGFFNSNESGRLQAYMVRNL
jgi:hypothetical protein